MSGIAGFCNLHTDMTKESNYWRRVLHYMRMTLINRSPEDVGETLHPHIAMAHTRLSIIGSNHGHQPMTRYRYGNSYTLVYNGELYNKKELRDNLSRMGYLFKTQTDTEVILVGLMEFGIDFIKEINGVFSIAFWDDNEKSFYLIRDRMGVKPLFYTMWKDTFVFSSEIKALFEFPGITPRIDSNGLCEIFGLGPAKTYGNGVFKDIYEVRPGHFIRYNMEGFQEVEYWKLVSKPHEDSYQQTVEKTAYLIHDAVKRQMISDDPICTFLSGGLDSSIISSICTKELGKENKQLTTYSFDFAENDKHFQSNSFQPSQDRPFVEIMVKYLNSNHTHLECDNINLANHLYQAVDARDLPNMADVESSLLYFCRLVSQKNRIALTGECADEIFGGYPWFHKPELMSANTFPWSKNMETRKLLLSDDLLSTIDLDGYVQAAYNKSLAETPRLEDETREETRRREIAYLNLKWFMITLLDRMDRTSMYSGLVARVPFADHRIVEYIWNVPWEMKCPDGVAKGLLRDAAKDLLPNEILYRKKSPYPKTYHPEYEHLLAKLLLEALSNPNAPLRPLVDMKKIIKFISSPSDYGKPWYGQLMAGPQLIAYLLQVNYWLDKYKIEIV